MNRESFSATIAATLVLGARSASAQLAPYKIGATWALTGQSAPFVSEVLKGGQVAVDEINSRGGVNGHQLQLIAEDAAGTPQGGVTAMRKLIDINNVHVIVSALTNVVAAQLTPAEQSKVPVFAPIESPGLLDKAPYGFAHAGSWDLYLQQLVVGHMRTKGYKRVYGLLLNNTQGQLQSPIIRAAAQSIGAEYGESLIDAGQTDFRSVADRILDFSADAVIVGQQGGIVENTAIRQLRERSTKAVVYNLGQTYASATIQSVLGPTAVGTIWAGIYLDPSKAPKFVADFKAISGGINPSTQAGEMYDIVRMIAFAMGRAGDSGEGIQRELAALKGFPSIFGGTVDMGPNHRTVIKAIGLFEVKSVGQLVRVP